MIFFRKSWDCDISPAYAAGILLGYISLIFYPLPQLFQPRTTTAMLAYTCAAGIVFILFACSMALLSHPEDSLARKFGIKRPEKSAVKESLYLLAGLLPAIWAVTWHWKFTMQKLEIPFSEQQELLQIVDFTDPAEVALLIMMSVIIIPVVEELIFRRILFGEISRTCGFNASGFITSGIFSAVHGYLAGAPGLFIGGIAFQWCNSRSGNLTSSIILHAMFNAVSLVFCLTSKLCV